MSKFEITEFINLGELKAFAASLGPQTLRNYDHFNTGSLYQWFCVRDGDKQLAYGFLRRSSHPRKTHLLVLGMVVADECQDKGIGTKLGEYMIQWAKTCGYKKIALGVYADNGMAIIFYRKLGFDQQRLLNKEELEDGKYRHLFSMAMYL